MPARSEAQQRLMGMALSAKRGKGHYGGKVKEIANSMTLKQLHDFAATKHEGLPEKKAFVEGFVKRANEYGFNPNEAIELLKEAESSWLGRYMAAKTVPQSIAMNKAVIMNEIDPTGEFQEKNLFMTPETFKKQRELAYGHLRNTLKRSTAAGTGKNFLLGAGLGGLVGAVQGGVLGEELHHDPLTGAGIGGLAGGLTLGGIMALENLAGRLKNKVITDEDIAKMREQQKHNSITSEFMPFREMIDAHRAGKPREQ